MVGKFWESSVGLDDRGQNKMQSPHPPIDEHNDGDDMVVAITEVGVLMYLFTGSAPMAISVVALLVSVWGLIRQVEKNSAVTSAVTSAAAGLPFASVVYDT